MMNTKTKQARMILLAVLLILPVVSAQDVNLDDVFSDYDEQNLEAKVLLFIALDKAGFNVDFGNVFDEGIDEVLASAEEEIVYYGSGFKKVTRKLTGEEEVDFPSDPLIDEESFISRITGAVIGVFGGAGSLIAAVFIILVVGFSISVRMIRKRKFG